MKNIFGLLLSALLAVLAILIARVIPYHIISASVFALLLGMALNPLLQKTRIGDYTMSGIQFVSKKVLRIAIILMGLTLSFDQVVKVGGFSLFVMVFTLLVAFGGGYLVGRLFKMNWKLSSLISAGTGICGGSAIAAIAPVIKAKDEDIAYGISATFLFDVLMVILFPIMGRAFEMSDMGFGLWAGTAVNDTSSVVAAGYAFSDAAGQYSVIVKLTRTLSIVPIVLIFSLLNHRIERKEAIAAGTMDTGAVKVNFFKIFPFFILGFLAMVALKSTGWLPEVVSTYSGEISKFAMVMALGAIGLKTNFKAVAKSGLKPMIHGFIISLLVVVVAYFVQMLLGQI